MTEDEDFAEFRPRMGRRAGRGAHGQHRSLRNVLLACVRGVGRGRRAAPRSGISVSPPAADARRVVIKAHVARLGRGGAKAAALHLRYIQRDGVEKDGSRGVLYDARGPVRPQSFEEPRPGEKHQFRLIVAPEDADALDLGQYVRRVMARAERDLGRSLEWAAVNHFDTKHPHAHVVVRGVDGAGREVRFDRGYISNGLRWRAQEIATEELGPRLERDIRRGHAKEVTQERFTSLDRELERRAQDDRVHVRSSRRHGLVDESTLIARLAYLERLRLAERLSPSEWSLRPQWRETLRELGSRGDIIKQMHAAISGDPARYHIVRHGQALSTDGASPVVTGRVASKGLSDELKGAFYAVIETPNGRAYHVPLDARSAEALRPGDIVSLATKPAPSVSPLDRRIAEVARGHDGIYASGPATSPDSARAARRMRDLERLGLASPEGENRWKVPANLLEELERRPTSSPARHRLLVHKQPLSIEEQVRNPGPVWLDRVDTKSLAPYGLGAELHRAIERRHDALRYVGIASDDPNKLAKLRELERRSLAKDIAARSKQVFHQGTPDRFRGRVLEAHMSPTGTSYTVVSDGRRFVLVKTNVSLRSLAGKTVTLTREPHGRLVARETPDRGLER